MLRNGYPPEVIDQEIYRFLNKKLEVSIDKKVEMDKTVDVEDDNKRKLFLVLPYINDTVEDFGKRLVDLVVQFYSDVELKVLFTCPNTISKLFSFKEKTPLTLQSLVVYRMNCLDCNEFYVGKTSRCLQRRVKEHRLGTGTEEYKSALFKHARSTGHRIDYNNPVILDKASNDNKLLLK